VLEVAPGKYLFALLGERSTNELATHTWADQLPRNADEAWTKIETLREIRDVPRAEYPLLVTFTDINDPKSVKEVKPDKLAEVFGAGYSLSAITLEITDEVATGMLVTSMPFWHKLVEQRTLSGLTEFNKSQPDPINYLTYDVFMRGN
jgi:hypothetical protein